MPAEAPSFDDAAIAAAEAALADLAAEYPGYARTDVNAMKTLAGRLGVELIDGRDLSASLAELHSVAHNITGQGASFGYDLMTILGEALCDRLRECTVVDALALTQIRRLIAACEAVLDERLTGQGGARGAALLAALGVSPALP